MAPRRRKAPVVESDHVRALIAKTDQLLDEQAKVRELARGSLIDHFQQSADNLPIPEDQARRERMAKRGRRHSR